MTAHVLTPDLASRFARLALAHVEREYPNKLDHVMRGPDDVRGPRALHPVFFGSFDWHSCVHGYWTLATVLRLYPKQKTNTHGLSYARPRLAIVALKPRRTGTAIARADNRAGATILTGIGLARGCGRVTARIGDHGIQYGHTRL